MEQPGLRIAKVVFLGTGSALPSPDYRNTSALALVLSTGKVVLVDCGEATQHQVMRSSSLVLSRIDAILITHLHGDHCFGLFGLLLTMGAQGRTDGVAIVGPAGIRRLVETVLETQGGLPPMPLHFVELSGEGSHDLGLFTDGLRVSAHFLSHRVAAYGYAIAEPEKPGALDAARAKALGASGRQLGQLKAGEDVALPDGRVIRSVDCLGAPVPGRRVVVLQDTCDSRAAAAAAAGCELLVHEATYDAALADKALLHGHSTAAMAGRFAAQVGARVLALSHFSVRYRLRAMAAALSERDRERRREEFAVCVDDLVAEAAACCPATHVVAAADFLVLDGLRGFAVAEEPFDLAPDAPARRQTLPCVEARPQRKAE
jgi:ribonuclease Z